MSILPILGCIRSFCLPLSFFEFSFSSTLARIFSMPVAAMNSGSWKGGFSIPRLPIRNLRFWHQCLGTGMVLRYDLRCTSNRGSSAVVSHDCESASARYERSNRPPGTGTAPRARESESVGMRVRVRRGGRASRGKRAQKKKEKTQALWATHAVGRRGGGRALWGGVVVDGAVGRAHLDDFRPGDELLQFRNREALHALLGSLGQLLLGGRLISAVYMRRSLRFGGRRRRRLGIVLRGARSGTVRLRFRACAGGEHRVSGDVGE